jgi:hypothetical protein
MSRSARIKFGNLLEILGLAKRKFAMFIAPRDFDIAMQERKYKWSY